MYSPYRGSLHADSRRSAGRRPMSHPPVLLRFSTTDSSGADSPKTAEDVYWPKQSKPHLILSGSH